MNVAIVIPCCTRTDLLKNALYPLRGLTIYVVNDGEKKITASDNVQILRTPVPRSGFAKAVNVGLACAQEECVQMHTLLARNRGRGEGSPMQGVFSWPILQGRED